MRADRARWLIVCVCVAAVTYCIATSRDRSTQNRIDQMQREITALRIEIRERDQAEEKRTRRIEQGLNRLISAAEGANGDTAK